MKSIKVLDVTLRDGGCVNNFDFGQAYMEKILSACEQSKVEYIELGYIDEKNGSKEGRTQYINEKVIPSCILRNKKNGIKYVAMIDYGKFDIDNLQERTVNGIDGIRIAFHKKDRKEVLKLGRKIIDKGYEVFIQPMITLRYSDVELIELIEDVNMFLPDASGFYIVDSFGEMRPNDMNRVLNLIDHNLREGMLLGFHSHNNLQMSYSNAVALLQFPTNRDLMLDSSIMGMGKGAGNLNTELLLEHLNLFYGKCYNIQPLLEVIDKVINQIHSEFYWGYAPEYYLSSANHCTPSYASYFYNKHMLPVDQVNDLLSLISEEKKISFDKEYAEGLYQKYNESKMVDDDQCVAELKTELNGKRVLVIAPGKSINTYKETIEKISKQKDVVTFTLNILDNYKSDYVMVTRKDVYDNAMTKDINILVSSNVSKGGRGNVKVLNYKNWVEINDDIYDGSGVILLNVISKCDVKEINLAGFDGFSVDINENYCNKQMRRPVTAEIACKRNDFYTEFLGQIATQNNVKFITPSRYNKENKYD